MNDTLLEYDNGSTVLERLINSEYTRYIYNQDWINEEEEITKEYYKTIKEVVGNYNAVSKLISLNEEIVNEISIIQFKKGFEIALKLCKELNTYR